MPLNAQPMGGKDALNKRIPKSTRYGNVKSVVKSGHSKKMEDERFDKRLGTVRFRRDENFRRIKIKDLDEVMRTEALDILLLDIRDEDEFAALCIRGAPEGGYFAACVQLGTTQPGVYPTPPNPFTPEILDYSNREPERIIVLYDWDEHKAIAAGNLFFEKGMDNVFVLSGGLKQIEKEIPWVMDGKQARDNSAVTSPKQAESVASFRSVASSAFSYQTQAPARKAAVDGPVTHNQSTGHPWK